MSDHAQWADAAGAYVLGALDEIETAGYEAHLGGCAECRQEVDFLRVATDALPMAAQQFEAPPELKDRIMNVVNSEAQLLRAAGPEADRPAEAPAPWVRGRRRWWSAIPRPALALATAGLLVIGGFAGFELAGDGGPAAPTRTVVAEVTEPGATASLLVRDQHSTLVAKKLPRAGRGRIYQVWLKRAGKANPEPTDALFAVRHDGSASVDVPGSLKGVEAVLVTSEPEGGSQKPTRPVVITAVPA
jgi:anti-sigma-K factor RskA